MHIVNYIAQCKSWRRNEIGKMGTGRAPQKYFFICNACSYKAKLVFQIFEMGNYFNIANNEI